MFDDIGFDLRRTFRGVLGPLVAALVLFFAVGLVILGVVGFAAKKNQPTAGPLDSHIPIAAATAGMVESYQCVQDGAPKCPDLDGAKNFIKRTTPAEGIEVNGTPYTLNDTTSDEDWRRFAAAATLNGRVTADQVTENTVKESGSGTGKFFIEHPGLPAVAGTMTFNLSGETFQVKSINYSNGR